MAKDRQVSLVPRVPKGNESWGPHKDSQQKVPGGEFKSSQVCAKLHRVGKTTSDHSCLVSRLRFTSQGMHAGNQ